MGAIESTIRWTPFDQQGGAATDPNNKRRPKLAKSNSFPPPSSPSTSSNSISNNDSNDDYYYYGGADNDYNNYGGGGDYDGQQAGVSSSAEGGDHLTTSGILMGVNAPPLYDACLVGRWEEVLSICNNSDNNSGDTLPTTCETSTLVEEEEDEEEEKEGNDEDAASNLAVADEGPRGASNTNSAAARRQQQTSSSQTTNHPCLQTRYTDRRRNTPLHLACRRQPPPAVIRALLNASPSEASIRRTTDGLTPLHFAVYCGAGLEVVNLLVESMTTCCMLMTSAAANNNQSGGTSSSSSNTDVSSPPPPPTRLLDRRRRTPLHCALSGFRTPVRPSIVRSLLRVDPQSSTMEDERGRTPLTLLFDDYAEEIMEALEDDVSVGELRERCWKKGGELYECWSMLSVLLRAAYLGSVPFDDETGAGGISSAAVAMAKQNLVSRTRLSSVDERDSDSDEQMPPQDSQHQSYTNEVNVQEYSDRQFSIVHAAAGVWECPAPLAKLVLKCMCAKDDDFADAAEEGVKGSEGDEWDHHVIPTEFERGDPTVTTGDSASDIILQPDSENMRLPLHIAVCARYQSRGGREGYSSRIKAWLSSSEVGAAYYKSSSYAAAGMRRQSSSDSVTSGISNISFATGMTNNTTRTGRSRATSGQVYNPRFGRSLSRESVVSQHRISGSGFISSTTSVSSSMANMARAPFLQHTMVKDILDLHPGAASMVDPSTGKLPIVMAIENGKSWETAVGPLLEAYPRPFGGNGDGGMALPDDGDAASNHRVALQAALMGALINGEGYIREEAIRTAGRLASWGGVWGMSESLDVVVSEWLDVVIHQANSSDAASPEGIIVGPGVTAVGADMMRMQSSILSGVAEVVFKSRPGSISDRVARSCLDCGSEFLFSVNTQVREASARVLGATLESVGDSDDAFTVMRELVLDICCDESSTFSASSAGKSGGKSRVSRVEEDVIIKHGKLLACNSILSIKWGSQLMASKDISDATVALLRRRSKDRNPVIRSAAYRAIGPLLGRSPSPSDHKLTATTTTLALKEMRHDILKGTRASEQVDVQLALARGLISAARMHPNLFLCKAGMPILDAALMLAMSKSTRPNVQKQFQIFLWVALQMGKDNDQGQRDGPMMSAGLDKYIKLAEGENGRIMMKFVTSTLAKIEDLEEEQF
eukprot:CAMPEP_0201711444 /NCGR_PEP_ID=MMETSP0578-20130828/59143_1 /ASSEMBLY_ACC=CAM_ASM_000663 /TAXON_ID=267565 /ORGANISM="Skeletonema grethea, Strain CCMP 1804" /LENGTH=1162 /DNA_ID=CAMNT_0048200495 /DNA_START=58 /DNA_END=3546 /DNA_ORIENTATION=-